MAGSIVVFISLLLLSGCMSPDETPTAPPLRDSGISYIETLSEVINPATGFYTPLVKVFSRMPTPPLARHVSNNRRNTLACFIYGLGWKRFREVQAERTCP